MLAATVGSIFPSVFVIDEPGPPDALGNTMLVATKSPQRLEDFYASVAALTAQRSDEFGALAQQATSIARVAPETALVPFTDDHAPIEWLVHRIVFEYLLAAN